MTGFSHPWHGIAVEERGVENSFPAVIEVPRGDKNKYELDKKTGLLRLDRVLHGAVHYPANYGFIPRTFCEDDDPLDVLVLAQEPVHPLTIVEARAIGVMGMLDEKGADDKIIAVSIHDPAFAGYNDREDLPPHIMQEIVKFFEEYKTLENKEVRVGEIEGAATALKVLKEALAMYRDLFA